MRRSVMPGPYAMRLACWGIVVATTTLVSLFTFSVAHAACSAIPAANNKGFYLSEGTGAALSRINRPIAGPGSRIMLDSGCVGTAFPSDEPDRIRIQFEFIGTGGTKSVVYGPFKPLAPTFPAQCTSSCNYLEFEMPDTGTSMVGPARIKVTDINDENDPTDDTTIVTIGRLFAPSIDCPPVAPTAPEEVFGFFTVLPRPMEFDATAPGTGFIPIYGALDFNGNLLVPVDFESARFDSVLPVATLLGGDTNTKACSGGAKNLLKHIRDNASNPRRQLRSFTPDGKPLPPLMALGDSPAAMMGLVDADQSVLRLQRKLVGGTTDLFDLSCKVLGDVGAVQLTYRPKKTLRRRVPLLGMRSSRETIAFARDEHDEGDLDGDGRLEHLLEIIDIDGAKPDEPRIAVAVRPRGSFFEPLIAVAGKFAAVLEPIFDSSGSRIEKHFHRVVRNTGGIVVPGDREASLSRRIDGEPVAISEKFPFYLEPSSNHDALAALRAAGAQPSERPPVTKVKLHGEHAVLLVPESILGVDKNFDNDQLDDVAFFYSLANQSECLVSLEVAATDIAISEESVVVLADEFSNDRADMNHDGDWSDTVPALWRLSLLAAACQSGAVLPSPVYVPYAVDTIATWKKWAVFIAPESQQNEGVSTKCKGGTFVAGACDLNGDGDPNDRVLFAAARALDATQPPKIEMSGHAVLDFQVGEGFVAFRVPEYDQGNADINNDGDTNDAIMHTFRPRCPGGLPKVSNDGKWSALACDFAACDPRYPYRVIGNMVWFLTDDHQAEPIAMKALSQSGCTLNDPAIPLFAKRTGFSPIVSIDKLDPLPPFPQPFMGSEALLRSTLGSGAGGLVLAGDYDDDGALDLWDNCPSRPNADQLDGDADGIGDRYCDTTPAVCPDEPNTGDCSQVNEPARDGLCYDTGGAEVNYAWRWPGADPDDRVNYPGHPLIDAPHYSLCVYAHDDESPRGRLVLADAILSWPACGNPPCWKGNAQRGFTYVRGEPEMPGNIDTVVLPAKSREKQALYIRGTLADEVPEIVGGKHELTVQLFVKDAGGRRCWSGMHESASRGFAGCPDPTAPKTGTRRKRPAGK